MKDDDINMREFLLHNQAMEKISDHNKKLQALIVAQAEVVASLMEIQRDSAIYNMQYLNEIWEERLYRAEKTKTNK